MVTKIARMLIATGLIGLTTAALYASDITEASIVVTEDFERGNLNVNISIDPEEFKSIGAGNIEVEFYVNYNADERDFEDLYGAYSLQEAQQNFSLHLEFLCDFEVV